MAKILISSPGFIGKSMAGAAIRCWEFAKALSSEHEVILLAPNYPIEITSPLFKIVSHQDAASAQHFENAHVFITQRLSLPLALKAKKHHVKIIIDAYDPSPLEIIETFRETSPFIRKNKVDSEISTLIFSFQMADGILCASEKQRDLWLGFLLANQLIKPQLYDQDPSLRHFISIVPFGLSQDPPKKNGKGLRERYGFLLSDKVLLWGGGIWNWFDPLTLIEAMKIIQEKRQDVKLVFMGVKPPDPHLTTMAMANQALERAKELGLLNRCVFFNHEWIPYEERQNFLLEADIGISTHFDQLETTFSFRTRLLDYLWAELPIIATEGDAFADLIRKYELGQVAPYQHPVRLSHMILELIDHPERINTIRKNVSKTKQLFYWETVTVSLQNMIDRLSKEPSRFCKKTAYWQMLTFVFRKIKEKGVRTSFKKAYEAYCCKTQ